jgi:cell division protein FtsN
LTIGQLFTLTFGFLLASVAIFVVGLWVGRDLANRRQEERNAVLRIAVEEPAPTVPPTLRVGVVVIETVTEATATGTVPATPQSTPTEPLPSTQRPRWQPTNTRRAAMPTRSSAAAAAWTVQVTATNDQVQALVTSRQLRSKGYDAYTVQAEIGGATWWRVQVGKFSRRAEADEIVHTLQRSGFEAAFVSDLR